MSTAVSGSGPAFVLLFMEAMIDAAVHLGFSRAEAQTLVMQTVKGTSAYLEVSGEHSGGTAQSGD
jgi:pyrroline-5-carboxylate reductase